MWNWFFPPACPCDPHAKASWVERRLAWLEEAFDDHAFNGRPLVLPQHEFFPARYDGSQAAVRTLLERVCGYIDVDPELIDLRFTSDAGKMWLVNQSGQYLPHAAGTYEDRGDRFRIRIDRSGLDDPMGLVGTLAHELAHVRLMGEGRIDGDVYDNELLTDLTVVLFGLGIFLANVPRNWVSQYSKWPDTDYNRPEYMTPPMFGYALAHLAWFRGERSPAWARHLHLNARPSFTRGVRYLFETRESEFRPVKFRDE